MYEIELAAGVPLEPEEIFEQVHAFDRCLTAAPAVTSVSRDGTGGVGTTYTIELARLGTSGSIYTVVTAVEPYSAIHWKADRSIEGSWRFDRDGRDLTTITISIRIDPDLLHNLPVTTLLRLGGDRLLRRELLREVRPVLKRAVADAGGPVDGLEVTVVKSGRVVRRTEQAGNDDASRDPV